MKTTMHATDAAAIELEWQVQEHALHQEQLGASIAGATPRELRYRLLSRALREPVPDGLPANFAQQVACIIEAECRVARRTDFRLELILTCVVMAIFGLAVSCTIATYGANWLLPIDLFRSLASALSKPWLSAFAVCIGISMLWGGWHRHSH
jgi:hypothetical protein